MEGTSNFFSFKDVMEVVLVNNGVWEYTQNDIKKSTTLDAQALAQWKKDIAKSKRIILKGVKDHVVLILHGKKIAYAMWKTLIDLFERNNDAMKLALKDKLRNI